MLNEYMPLLFQKIPDILRASFDIEVGSQKNILPNPNNPKQEIISIATATPVQIRSNGCPAIDDVKAIQQRDRQC